MRSRGLIAVALAVSIGIILLLWATEPAWFRPTEAPGRNAPPTISSFHFANFTSQLGTTFVHGAPQAFGFNGSVALVTGVVGVPGPSTIPLALLGTLGGVPAGSISLNRSDEVSSLFHGGDTLGIGWNGTAWVITGEAAWGSLATGAAASLSRGHWTNLTPILGPYFGGQGGIWFDAWNGSAWMFGGASDSGAALVAFQGGSVRDLTPLIPNNCRHCWIQFIAWNGTSWLVGGHGVFGALTGSRYVDLYPASPFTGGGMYAGDWNGSAWLVGGGTPGSISYLRGTSLTPGPALSPSFSWWVSNIVWDGHGWLIAGKGTSSLHTFDAKLEYFDAATAVLVDLSAGLPGAFAGGQIQFGALAPFVGPESALLVGQGGLPSQKGVAGASEGAAVVVTRG